MKLTDGEKIIIAMLADIHKKLGVEGETDLNLLMKSIYGGHLWSLKHDMSGLLHDYVDDDEEVKETYNILDMWRVIEPSFDDLDINDKSRVRAANHGHDPKFSGFDGNNEPHFGIAKHLVDVMGRYSEFADRDLNSHSPVVPRYLQMYGVFAAMLADLGTRPARFLTADEIIKILEAT